MAKISKKKMLEALKDRFHILETTEYYNLYDRTKHGSQSYNGAWVAAITILNGYYIYRDREYATVDQMIEAIEAYNATLPFNPEYYNPTYRKNVMISLCCADYMKTLGFQRSWSGAGDLDKFIYPDPQNPGANLFTLELHVDDMKETGKVMQWLSGSTWSEIEFDGLDSAIAAINSMMAVDALCKSVSAAKILNNMTAARHDGEFTRKQFNDKTLQVYATNEKERLIELLEKELESLKKMK